MAGLDWTYAGCVHKAAVNRRKLEMAQARRLSWTRARAKAWRHIDTCGPSCRKEKDWVKCASCPLTKADHVGACKALLTNLLSRTGRSRHVIDPAQVTRRSSTALSAASIEHYHARSLLPPLRLTTPATPSPRPSEAGLDIHQRHPTLSLPQETISDSVRDIPPRPRRTAERNQGPLSVT